MSRRSILLLYLSVVSSCCASIRYSRVSKTLSGKPCMSTCVEGSCFVDHHFQPTACTVDHLAGVPVHFTQAGNMNCLSNCGKWGKDYMWCYTTESYDWDYCNDEVKTPGLKVGRDKYGRRCVDDCSIYGFSYSTEGTCRLESQEYVTCTTAGYIPVQSCSAIFLQPKRARRGLDKIFSDSVCAKTCHGRYRDGLDGETRTAADAVYTTYNNVNNITTFPAGSPYLFAATTTVTNANNQQVLLPLILEARIQHAVYKPRGSSEVSSEGIENVNRMYDAFNSTLRPGIQVGHLLAYSNGGTTDLFNYAGQTQQLNIGPYKRMENEINSWLRFGYVDFQVVLVYIGTRPSQFHVKLKFYNNDGSLHSDCLDMVFRNI